MARWIVFFIFSLIIHLCMGIVLYYVPTKPVSQNEPIEVVIQQNPKSLREKQIVLKSLVPQWNLKESEEETPFQSEQRQRVKEQMQASKTGLTENAFQKGSSQQKTTQSGQKTAKRLKARDLVYNFEGMEVQKRAREELRKETSSIQTDSSVSRINEALSQKVRYGDFTALNTDASLYYSFYSRNVPQIRFYWEQSIEEAIAHFTRQQISLGNNENWSTRVEVILDSKGYLKNIFVHRSAGVQAFDFAVVNAFRLSQPFLNPPPGMVQDDGLIHLNFSFRVAWTPRYLARPQSR